MVIMTRVFNWHGKKYYLIGTDTNGDTCWLEESKFDCGWYWGIGYVEGFTNKNRPWLSRDISFHTHFDYLMNRNQNKSWFDTFKQTFVETPLTEREIWLFLELMMSLYTARKYSDMLWRGGSYYTKNLAQETIKNEEEYKRINEEVIPTLLRQVYRILDGTFAKEEAERNAKAS